jgi:hypothetical protein
VNVILSQKYKNDEQTIDLLEKYSMPITLTARVILAQNQSTEKIDTNLFISQLT